MMWNILCVQTHQQSEYYSQNSAFLITVAIQYRFYCIGHQNYDKTLVTDLFLHISLVMKGVFGTNGSQEYVCLYEKQTFPCSEAAVVCFSYQLSLLLSLTMVPR